MAYWQERYICGDGKSCATTDWGVWSADSLNDVFPEVAAFNVAELGEMLPGRIIRDDGRWFTPDFHKDSTTYHWYCYYLPIDKGIGEIHTIGDTEADARAKMLVYLIENELIEVSD